MSTLISDLVEFLKARYDEDEREIRVVLQPDEPSPQLLTSHRAFHLVLTHELGDSWPTGSPRMFADVEAKRRIIELHDQGGERWEGFPRADKLVSYCLHDQQAAPCQTLCLLALPYAEHPDYREEWRP